LGSATTELHLVVATDKKNSFGLKSTEDSNEQFLASGRKRAFNTGFL
jgi:hypothetical protein